MCMDTCANYTDGLKLRMPFWKPEWRPKTPRTRPKMDENAFYAVFTAFHRHRMPCYKSMCICMWVSKLECLLKVYLKKASYYRDHAKDRMPYPMRHSKLQSITVNINNFRLEGFLRVLPQVYLYSHEAMIKGI